MNIKTKAELFEKWSSDQDWKDNEHCDLAWKFDRDCKVFDYYNDSGEVYGERTLITFSDGTEITMNYKGETE